MDRKPSAKQIITSALASASHADALALEKLIEQSIGARHQRPVGDRYNNYGLMASSGSYEYKSLEPVTNMQDTQLERLAMQKFGDLAQAPYMSPEQAAKDLLSGLTYQQQADRVSVRLLESDPPARSSKRLTVV